jgi:beta-phosphoglucomutase-like phosphatase (HAD superfamily)
MEHDQRMTSRHDLVENWWSKARFADALVFDLDGTLVNTDLANFLSYEAAISKIFSGKLKITFNPIKRTTRETIKNEFPALSIDNINNIVMEKELIFHKYLTKTVLNSDVASILKRSNGKINILATNSRKNRAEMLLKHHGLTNKFVHILCRDSETQSDKYVDLRKFMPSKIKSLIIFEDDYKEINRAISAGIHPDLIINVRAQW